MADGKGVHEDDGLGPLFFLSYAHSVPAGRQKRLTQDPGQHFIRFFDDLSENVGELIARLPGSDPGYIDHSIPSGRRWSKELLDALSTCQVFVALLSAQYFSRPWCGMEWHAFSQRAVVSRPDHRGSSETAIIPVIWASLPPPEQIPSVISAAQRFAPHGLPDGIAAQYEKDGVFGLMRMGHDSDYDAVVWRIAQRVAELHYSFHVQPGDFLDDSSLRDIFREQP
jgi:hypothetical protein